LEFGHNDPNLDHVGFLLSSDDDDTNVDLAGVEEDEKESEGTPIIIGLAAFGRTRKTERPRPHCFSFFLPPRQNTLNNDMTMAQTILGGSARVVGERPGAITDITTPFGAIRKCSSLPHGRVVPQWWK
jgi:hypothetical protein